MNRVAEMERALENDPLAARLARIEVPPVPEALWASVLTEPRPAPQRRRRFRVAIGFGAGAVALATLAVTPAGAAIGRTILPQGIQQKLGIFEGAPTHLAAPSGVPGGSGGRRVVHSLMPCSQVPATPPYPTALQGVECYPDLSLAEAQRRVDFTIPTPTAMPPGLSYRGALVGITMGAPKSSVLLTYRDATGTKSLGLQVVRGTPGSGSAVPSGVAQRVTVDGSPAYYVHGSYGDDGPGTAVRWNSAADDEELTWQHDGFTYDLTTAGLHFSSADLIRIAESVR